MTREEQTEWLCRLRTDLNNGVIFTPWNKEFAEALTGVLEQEPCEDAISRKSVLKIYNKWFNSCNIADKKESPKAQINALPPVTPQPKTGRWIFCEGTKGKDNVEKCSCCQSHWKEAVVYRSDTQEYLRLRLKYCPNCGAKMIEPQESEG